uniref:Uncharacterized protein n=1 Tax=Sinocyclocheilus anshuiensis TaxID=1608454 RepID=A0A671KID7_9TELE
MNYICRFQIVSLIASGVSSSFMFFNLFRLYDCGVTDEGCAALASALRSNPSHLRKLDLSLNELGDSGVNLLSDGLKDPHCKLETLMLSYCGITDEGCAALASALRSDLSHLRYLVLARNNLQDTGVKLLSDGLKDPHCKLEKLRLNNCGITGEGCAALASALRSNPSHLRELNLNGNNLRDSDVKLISSPCIFNLYRLSKCGVTDEVCAALASALRSNPSHLRELHLSLNELGDSGVNLLSDLLKDPHCKLETLWFNHCGVTDEGCAALASALRSNPSHLRDLDLTGNKLRDSGVKLLSDQLKDSHCKLEKLLKSVIVLYRLSNCGVTDEGCAALASALRSNPSHLRELNMSWNKLGDTAVNLLSDLLKGPYCNLETFDLFSKKNCPSFRKQSGVKLFAQT